MLTKYSYVFIIGAGGGKPYKFPLGDELYKNICNNYLGKVEAWLRNMDIYNFPRDVFIEGAEEYTNALSQTIGISIDKYLNINKKFKKPGIHSIISEIYSAEQDSFLPSNMNSNSIQGDWFTYLFKKLIQNFDTAEDLLNFNENKINFITFNYDRSLEHFLFENLYGVVRNANISRQRIAQVFNKIPFIHIYGQIGFLPWQKEIYDEKQNYYNAPESILSYGGKNILPMEVGLGFSKMIEIMYEERKDHIELNLAKQLIKKADRVMFLGFGYDELNLKILGIPETISGKQVYGTAYNATSNEIIHISKLLNLDNADPKSKIKDYDNLMLLREHLI